MARHEAPKDKAMKPRLDKDEREVPPELLKVWQQRYQILGGEEPKPPLSEEEISEHPGAWSKSGR